jgi:hypothetical protein
VTSDSGLPRGKFSGRKWLMLVGVLALALGGFTGVLTFARSESASAANVSLNQCNNVSNTGGLTVECHVVIVNNLTNDPSTTGSVVTVNGGSPVSSSDLVTSVTQCNGSANGGGGTLNCSVQIINNIAVDGPSGATGVTINQCNGNQANDGLGNAPNTCNPFPASTSGATITQCNGSGNGGGLVSPSHCDASGTVSSTLPVTVNQCNGSANGGGSKVNCSTAITTNVIDTTPGPGPTTTTSVPGGGGGTPGGGDTPGGGTAGGGGTPGGGGTAGGGSATTFGSSVATPIPGVPTQAG